MSQDNVCMIPVWLPFTSKVTYTKYHKDPCTYVKVIVKNQVASFLLDTVYY